MSMPGPCVICGDSNYALSCGGPTICPKCDCGHFDAATVEKQARVIADLRQQLAARCDAQSDGVRIAARMMKDYYKSERDRCERTLRDIMDLSDNESSRDAVVAILERLEKHWGREADDAASAITSAQEKTP